MKNSWKTSSVFRQQLSLNLQELNGRYPPHWTKFLSLVEQEGLSNILDVGCGVGSYYPLLRREIGDITYTGCDFSEEAIHLAKNSWEFGNFFVLDFWELTEEILKPYDTILLNAFLDVLENGDEALNFLLSLRPNSVCIQRMAFTDEDSYYSTYQAYGIDIYKYRHNRENFKNIVSNNGYNLHQFGNDIDSEHYYLTRK
jgi:trans-aconitate methyltransferase